MRDPDNFDPSILSRYSVIRVHIEFKGQPPGEKLFVVLKHFGGKNSECLCLKATSKTARYEADPEQLAGCILYEYDELKFFPQRTVVQPDNSLRLPHSHLASEASKGRYKVVGKMPADFHAKLVAAIKNSVVLSQKEANELLEAIGEPPIND